jgi:hypothetical protein
MKLRSEVISTNVGLKYTLQTVETENSDRPTVRSRVTDWHDVTYRVSCRSVQFAAELVLPLVFRVNCLKKLKSMTAGIAISPP